MHQPIFSVSKSCHSSFNSFFNFSFAITLRLTKVLLFDKTQLFNTHRLTQLCSAIKSRLGGHYPTNFKATCNMGFASALADGSSSSTFVFQFCFSTQLDRTLLINRMCLFLLYLYSAFSSSTTECFRRAKRKAQKRYM